MVHARTSNYSLCWNRPALKQLWGLSYQSFNLNEICDYALGKSDRWNKGNSLQTSQNLPLLVGTWYPEPLFFPQGMCGLFLGPTTTSRIHQTSHSQFWRWKVPMRSTHLWPNKEASTSRPIKGSNCTKNSWCDDFVLTILLGSYCNMIQFHEMLLANLKRREWDSDKSHEVKIDTIVTQCWSLHWMFEAMFGVCSLQCVAQQWRNLLEITWEI